MEKPDNYADTQLKWSRCRSAAIEAGARDRVQECLAKCREFDLETDDILVLGPQHGYELEAFRDADAKSLIGVDTVADFVQDCAKLGFFCILGDAEELSVDLTSFDETNQQWNVYACHVLEHCYDFKMAVEQLAAVCKQWCYVVVPIESLGSSDKAHFSVFRHWSNCQVCFHRAGFGEVWVDEQWSRDKVGQSTVRALFRKTR